MDTLFNDGKLDRRVKVAEVLARYGFKRTTLYHAVKQGGFPKPHTLPAGRTRFWWESELLKYEEHFKNSL